MRCRRERDGRNRVIVPDEEIGVEELEENLTGEAEQQQEEENDEWIAEIRQGLGELFEDGWTTGELDRDSCWTRQLQRKS